jgi:hypothetical protein
LGNRSGLQYIVVNPDANRSAGVKAGDFVTITLETDTEKQEIEIPAALQSALGMRLTQKLDALPFGPKREFVVRYAEAKKKDTRARRVEKMKRCSRQGRSLVKTVIEDQTVGHNSGA